MGAFMSATNEQTRNRHTPMKPVKRPGGAVDPVIHQPAAVRFGTPEPQRMHGIRSDPPLTG